MTAAPCSEPEFVKRYRPILNALKPCCSEDEARRRIGMLYLRDRAIHGQRSAGHDAQRVLSVIEAFGCCYATAALSPDDLDVRHRAMIGLMSIATMIEVADQRAAARKAEVRANAA